ncbi:VOC family protein [Aeromicrobium sp. Leaf350]|uniref:VOC family protein n=1 Tax=Aeromicrobium sp. Leaf350 TaxID=2876565 RepID=UPI001E521677|nr:VOC family protein [Aeromicrobium sp. Leaf350]
MTDRDLSTFWRAEPSSEGRPPRVLIRVFLEPDRLGQGIAYYERLQAVEVDAIFPYPEAGLRLATVGGFLLIEGDDKRLAPFRSTTGTLLVDDVTPYYDQLVADGAEIVVPLQSVPTGSGFNARHPDGTVVEYVQHRPTPQELTAG